MCNGMSIDIIKVWLTNIIKGLFRANSLPHFLHLGDFRIFTLAFLFKLLSSLIKL